MTFSLSGKYITVTMVTEARVKPGDAVTAERTQAVTFEASTTDGYIGDFPKGAATVCAINCPKNAHLKGYVQKVEPIGDTGRFSVRIKLDRNWK